MKYMVRLERGDDVFYVAPNGEVANPYAATPYNSFDAAHDIVERYKLEGLRVEVLPHIRFEARPDLRLLIAALVGLVVSTSLGVVLGVWLVARGYIGL